MKNEFKGELGYLHAMHQVLKYGEERVDRTGVGTKSIFGLEMSFDDVVDEFPLVTTKKINFDAIKSELLWMLEGSGDERRLAEIRYGKPREELEDKNTIWTANAHSVYWVSRGLKKSEGDLGGVYGVQWRHWDDTRIVSLNDSKRLSARGFEMKGHVASGYIVTREVDQLNELVKGIKKDPFGRRHIISAWNPAMLDDMALPPCHTFAQFYVHTDGRLDCLLYQRSADLFLGSPFNIAFYSAMLAMVAQVCDLVPGAFKYRIGDAHVYLNHIEQVKEQLVREPFNSPTLWLNSSIDHIDGFSMSDIEVLEYTAHDAIKAPMAV